MGIGAQLKTAFTSPRSFFQQRNTRSLQEDLRFFFAIVAIVSVCFTLAAFLQGFYAGGNESGIAGWHLAGFILLGTVVGLLQGLIGGVIFLLGISLIEHFFLLFVDEDVEFEKTMKSVVYALFPAIPFFWAGVVVNVPLASLLMLICFGLITYYGIRVFHEKSKDRAAFVSLATSLVLLILFRRWIFIPGLPW
ncbi:hypothetical protein JCM10550A_16190 [Methanogenium cariaci]